MSDPLISLCMIVRDEEDVIEDCLKSAMTVTDEWIVVDTGSTDRTVEKCKSLGVTVIQHTWMNDFAEARNKGIERATGEWILWMDADEVLDATKCDQIRQAVLQAESDAIFIPVLNFIGESRSHVSPSNAYQLCQIRLFRNGKGIHFSGTIHEQLNNISSNALLNPVVLDVVINHYGYLEDRVKEKQKNERNLSLLRGQFNKPEHDPWTEYHIASELNQAGNDQEAFEMLNQSIKRFIKQKQIPPALVYKLKYDILIRNGSIKGIWPGIEKAIQLYPDYVDLHFYKGLFFLSQERIHEAIGVFEHCIQLGEKNWRYLILRGVGSFLAMEALAQCMESLEKLPEAAVDRELGSVGLSSDHDR